MMCKPLIHKPSKTALRRLVKLLLKELPLVFAVTGTSIAVLNTVDLYTAEYVNVDVSFSLWLLCACFFLTKLSIQRKGIQLISYIFFFAVFTVFALTQGFAEMTALFVTGLFTAWFSFENPYDLKPEIVRAKINLTAYCFISAFAAFAMTYIEAKQMAILIAQTSLSLVCSILYLHMARLDGHIKKVENRFFMKNSGTALQRKNNKVIFCSAGVMLVLFIVFALPDYSNELMSRETILKGDLFGVEAMEYNANVNYERDIETVKNRRRIADLFDSLFFESEEKYGKTASAFQNLPFWIAVVLGIVSLPFIAYLLYKQFKNRKEAEDDPPAFLYDKSMSRKPLFRFNPLRDSSTNARIRRLFFQKVREHKASGLVVRNISTSETIGCDIGKREDISELTHLYSLARYSGENLDKSELKKLP